MKAKVKATGKIINVVKDWEIYEGVPFIGYRDNEGQAYVEKQLEFLPDTPGEVTIEGWVAVDEAYCGEAYLHTEKPHAESVEFCDTGDYEIAWRSEGKSYLLDRNLFPDMNEETEPKKYRITITPME